MKSGFLDKLIERLDRIDPQSLQTHFLRLAQEKGLLETVFQSIAEGVLLLDGEGRVQYANKAAEQMLGVGPDEMQGRPISRYLPDIDWDRILGLDMGEWSRLISRQIEVTYPAHRYLSFYVVPVARSGSAGQGAVVMLRDITRDREEEASLLESERFNALKLLAAGVAHEIGNPLNALTIHLQLLEREVRSLPGAQRRELAGLVDVARREVARLDLIITQFLRAIRPAKPRLVLSRIEELLEESLALLRAEIEDRRIHVEINCGEPLPRIRVDRNQIKQAFFNVIKNALQAMSDGGRLVVSMSATDRAVGISFADTGIGIPAGEIGKIFDPYHTTKAEGSGLGLMVVQRIVQEHGGQIEVFSEPGSGTTFNIVLPRIDRRIRLLRSRHGEAERKAEEVPA